MNKDRIKKLVLVIPIALMLIALTQESYCTADACSLAIMNLLFGVFGIFIGGNETLSWYANPLLVLAWVFMVIEKYKTSLIMSMLSTCVALSFLMFDTVVINEAGHQAPITKYASGYWLWINSHVATLLGSIFVVYSQRSTE